MRFSAWNFASVNAAQHWHQDISKVTAAVGVEEVVTADTSGERAEAATSGQVHALHHRVDVSGPAYSGNGWPRRGQGGHQAFEREG